MAKKITENEINRLHDKFLKGTITKEEKKILYGRFKNLFTDRKGRVNCSDLDNFLYVSHKDYKKPDKDGVIGIV